jgi:hypothetical protein
MKISIKHLLVSVGLILFFTQCQKETFENSEAFNSMKDGHLVTEECTVVQDLWAGAGQNDTGKGTLVGTVTATIIGTELHVVYEVSAPWLLTEAHLWVGKSLYDIPKNAAPGQFPYKEYVDNETTVHFVVDLTTLGIAPGDPVYIAAHGVVTSYGDHGDFTELLPADVSYKVTYFTKYPDYGIVPPLSYFRIKIEEGFLAGLYNAWCLDTSIPVTQNQFIHGVAYSSYGMLPADLFDKPENLPALNWIINHIFVGDMSLGGYGAFTMGDIQRAMWLLIEDNPNLNVPGGVGPYNNDRVAEIVARALQYGLEFVPVCGQKMLIVLVAPNEQTCVIEVPVPCKEGRTETVWAYGQYTFKNLKIANKWGWIFKLHCEVD